MPDCPHYCVEVEHYDAVVEKPVSLRCHVIRKSDQCDLVMVNDNFVWLQVLERLCVSNRSETVLEFVVPEGRIDILTESESVCYLVEGLLVGLLLLVGRIPVTESDYAGNCLVCIFLESLLSLDRKSVV